MKKMRMVLVLALLVALSTAAFGWGNLTHAYIAKQVSSLTGQGDLRSLYGATLNDAFNLVMTAPGQVMYDQLHHNPNPFLLSATRCDVKSVAYGFASHNGLWGADYTAHEHVVPGQPDTGYAVLKGQEMTPTIAPQVLAILHNAGIDPNPTEYPDPTTDPVIQFAYGIAPELGHDLAETAVDILLKRQLDAADVPLGAMLMQSALKRPADVPVVLVDAYSKDVAKATEIPHGQVVKTILQGEKSWKETVAQYGGLFTLDEATVIAQLSAASAVVAGQYLTFYFNLTFQPSQAVTITVDPSQVSSFINVAIQTVQGTWGDEVAQTILFVRDGLESHNVNTCGSSIALQKEGTEAPTVAPDHFSLDGNYPNPFNPSTTIAFRLPVDAPVSLEIYNILGQKVRTLLDNAPYGSGAWTVVWDGKNDAGALLPSGAYLCRLSSPAGTMTRKLAMMK